MRRGQVLISIALILALGAFIIYAIWYLFIGNPFWEQPWYTGQHESGESITTVQAKDLSETEVIDFLMSGGVVSVEISDDLNKTYLEYNLDVEVNGSHAWNQHNVQATNAIRCITRNGTVRILSEKLSRNLHLICTDPSTGKSYVVIVEKIKQAVKAYANATTRFITAFELIDETVEKYIEYETKIKCIVINLQFSAGEVFFGPK